LPSDEILVDIDLFVHYSVCGVLATTRQSGQNEKEKQKNTENVLANFKALNSKTWILNHVTNVRSFM